MHSDNATSVIAIGRKWVCSSRGDAFCPMTMRQYSCIVKMQILGLISCTGTNFLLRAEAWRQCDGFPTYTLTEDFALGLELTLRGAQPPCT